MSAIKFPENAFSAFNDTEIAYEATRGSDVFRVSMKAADMGETFAEPLIDSDAANETKLRSFVIQARGEGAWNLPTFPQIGDRITLAAGVSYAVTKVADLAGSFSLEAKQC